MALKPDRTIRYQTFISSTFSDLRAERDAVTRDILAMEKCIPAGMELFGASPRPSWDVITSVLDLTDYVVLILGARYGSIKPGGRISFTHAEYRYAVERGLPVLAFLPHRERLAREDQREPDVQAQKKLERFLKEVETSGVQVDYWRDAQDLAHRVTGALWKAFQTTPRPGWRRGHEPLPSGHPEEVAAGASGPSPWLASMALRATASREADRHPLRDVAAVLVVAEPDARLSGAPLLAGRVDDLAKLLREVADETDEDIVAWSRRLGHRDIPSSPMQTAHPNALAVAGNAEQPIPWHPGSRTAMASCEVAVTDEGGLRIYSAPFGFRDGISGSYDPAIDLAVPTVVVHRALQLLVRLSEGSAYAGEWRVLVRTINAGNLPALTDAGLTAERLVEDYEERIRVPVDVAKSAPKQVTEQLLRNLFRQFPGMATVYSAGLTP